MVKGAWFLAVAAVLVVLLAGLADAQEKTNVTSASPTTKRVVWILDVKVNVLSSFIEEGQPVRFIVGLINLGDRRPFNVNLSYTVKDENDNIVAHGTDTRAIETTLSYVDKLNIPKTAKPGGYVVQVDAQYNGFTASSIDTFALLAGAPLGEFVFADWMFWLFLLSVAIVVLLLLRFRKGGPHHADRFRSFFSFSAPAQQTVELGGMKITAYPQQKRWFGGFLMGDRVTFVLKCELPLGNTQKYNMTEWFIAWGRDQSTWGKVDLGTLQPGESREYVLRDKMLGFTGDHLFGIGRYPERFDTIYAFRVYARSDIALNWFLAIAQGLMLAALVVLLGLRGGR